MPRVLHRCSLLRGRALFPTFGGCERSYYRILSFIVDLRVISAISAAYIESVCEGDTMYNICN